MQLQVLQYVHCLQYYQLFIYMDCCSLLKTKIHSNAVMVEENVILHILLGLSSVRNGYGDHRDQSTVIKWVLLTWKYGYVAGLG